MRRPQISGALRGLASAVALLGFAACNATTASAPDDPAYDLDVRPILMAHCARCHGAGDALNVPTEPTGPNAPMQKTITNEDVTTFNAVNIYLDRYDTDGSKKGAFDSRGLIVTTIGPGVKDDTVMPPPPAPRLNDWEIDVLTAWSKNAICSDSPDKTTICPNGAGPGSGP